jgi:hypothetical protein
VPVSFGRVLGAILHRSRFERDMAHELRAHLELRSML